MDNRAAKLALARKKLRDHQDKKLCSIQKNDNEDSSDFILQSEDHIYQSEKECDPTEKYNITVHKQDVDISSEVVQSDLHPNNFYEPDANITEILVTNKRNLELQIMELLSKCSHLELKFTSVVENYNMSKQKIIDLESELRTVHVKYSKASEDIISKERIIQDLNYSKSSWCDEKCNLHEQLEFTKNILTSKEAENDMLLSQLHNLQNQHEVTQLQLQQLTNGSSSENTFNNAESFTRKQNEELINTTNLLEKQLKVLQKDKDQINMHYEHYVGELNEELKTVMKKNEDLRKEVDDLSNRENSLIDQISDMEIRLQHFHTLKTEPTPPLEKQSITDNYTDYQQSYEKMQADMNDLRSNYEELQKLYAKSNAKIIELTQINESEFIHDNISISKLNADITSDKIAAQRATEQNKKLKQDMHGLEDAFVKMSNDKLELTEKLTVEKYLNRELTIKLAEIDEKTKDMCIKLKAKDDEMIRLQSSSRDIERKFQQLSDASFAQQAQINTSCDHSMHLEKCLDGHKEDQENAVLGVDEKHASENSTLIGRKESILKEDAMLKLQDRFLKIMEEVANLSDEKHRLEHIILQLQNETDTICEYVALYQQQRSLLKKRDEERSAQIKMFQTECDKLKSHLDELSKIISGFAEDKELVSYFQLETRRNELERAMNLLSNLKNNSLIDSKRNNIEFKHFYPCSCCSGQLIDV